MLISFLAVTYIAKLEDGTVYERKGSSEEPFEFTIMEGILWELSYLHVLSMDSVFLTLYSLSGNVSSQNKYMTV